MLHFSTAIVESPLSPPFGLQPKGQGLSKLAKARALSGGEGGNPSGFFLRKRNYLIYLPPLCRANNIIELKV
jgi:hypothetical protein